MPASRFGRTTNRALSFIEIAENLFERPRHLHCAPIFGRDRLSPPMHLMTISCFDLLLVWQ